MTDAEVSPACQVESNQKLVIKQPFVIDNNGIFASPDGTPSSINSINGTKETAGNSDTLTIAECKNYRIATQLNLKLDSTLINAIEDGINGIKDSSDQQLLQQVVKSQKRVAIFETILGSFIGIGCCGGICGACIVVILFAAEASYTVVISTLYTMAGFAFLFCIGLVLVLFYCSSQYCDCFGIQKAKQLSCDWRKEILHQLSDFVEKLNGTHEKQVKISVIVDNSESKETYALQFEIPGIYDDTQGNK